MHLVVMVQAATTWVMLICFHDCRLVLDPTRGCCVRRGRGCGSLTKAEVNESTLMYSPGKE